MKNQIERVLYYEREYLRSFDFIAEQNYHLEMRRRLNMALHLWGIVDGLEIKKGPVILSAPDQFYITPGMAIDAYGREIVLFNPSLLDDEALLNNRISVSGDYALWIAYHREPATPPAPGYRICDIKNQYTRWRETYRVIISNEPLPTQAPGVAGALSDNPDKDPWPIRLGTVSIGDVAGQRMVVKQANENRVYIGLRAQRIITPELSPPDPLPNPPVNPVLSKIAPLDAPLSLGVEAHLFAKKNLIVGENFEIDKTKIKPQPPGAFPRPTGNLKVTNDLFLHGNLYGLVNNKWLAIKEYVQSFIPEVKIGVQAIPVAPNSANANPSTGDVTISVSTILPTVSSAEMVVAITEVEWLSLQNAATWEAATLADNLGKTVPLQIRAEVTGKTNVNNQYNFNVHWTIGPTTANPPRLNVTALKVSYIVVFLP